MVCIKYMSDIIQFYALIYISTLLQKEFYKNICTCIKERWRNTFLTDVCIMWKNERLVQCVHGDPILIENRHQEILRQEMSPPSYI
jgi:hypothetical protein